jgi:hypothetical protein
MAQPFLERTSPPHGENEREDAEFHHKIPVARTTATVSLLKRSMLASRFLRAFGFLSFGIHYAKQKNKHTTGPANGTGISLDPADQLRARELRQVRAEDSRACLRNFM